MSSYRNILPKTIAQIETRSPHANTLPVTSSNVVRNDTISHQHQILHHQPHQSHPHSHHTQHVNHSQSVSRQEHDETAVTASITEHPSSSTPQMQILPQASVDTQFMQYSMILQQQFLTLQQGNLQIMPTNTTSINMLLVTTIYPTSSALTTQTPISSQSPPDASHEADEITDLVVVYPSKASSPDLVDLCDDDDEVTPEQEILENDTECTNHPMDLPIMPFFVKESLLPKPHLEIRHGTSQAGLPALILRMESTVDVTKCPGPLRYRIFFYLQDLTKAREDRQWKQLTCIKVKCGKICECTLTNLKPNVLYHFVACLVSGDYMSNFSNCGVSKFN